MKGETGNTYFDMSMYYVDSESINCGHFYKDVDRVIKWAEIGANGIKV